jgi:hypothetical protein
MPSGVTADDDLRDARAFAESVAGITERSGGPPAEWTPGRTAAASSGPLTAALTKLGWDELARDPGLVACAGLAGVQLGRRLAPLQALDRLLGGAPLAGDLVRCRLEEVVADGDGGPARRRLVRAEACASADGLEVHRVAELGEPMPVDPAAWAVATGAWLAAGVGYLAGLGEGALELTVGYVRQRRAFGGTLAALAPVQQALAGAATNVRGVALLAESAPGPDALAHAGEAVAEACAACQQATGAIGFTLEYPLHRFTQRARALAAWNEALLGLVSP